MTSAAIQRLYEEKDRLLTRPGCLGIDLCICDGRGIVPGIKSAVPCPGPDVKLRERWLKDTDKEIERQIEREKQAIIDLETRERAEYERLRAKYG